MTTVEREHEFHMYCQGKSNHQIYAEECAQRGIKRNSEISQMLPAETDQYDLKELDCRGNYLGPEGVRSLFDVIQANRSLEHVGFQNQGITDGCLHGLLDIIRLHPRLTSVDLSDNVFITNLSAVPLLTVVKENTMLCNVTVDGSRLGHAVQRKIKRETTHNSSLEAEFFKGDYVKLKKLFVRLDTDLSGTITLPELLSNIDIPRIANALVERFSLMDGTEGKRDNEVTVDEFLYYVYPHYKTIRRIQQYAQEDDVQEQTATANHKALTLALAKKRVMVEGSVGRVSDRLLAEEEIDRVVETALQHETVSDDAGRQVNGRLVISRQSIKHGLRSVWTPPELSLDEKRRDFRLSATFVKMLVKLFTQHATSHSPSAGTTSAVDPTPTVPLETLLASNMSTPLFKLKLKLLLPILQRQGLPLDLRVSLQEAVCLLEEYFDVVYCDVTSKTPAPSPPKKAKGKRSL
ncbi:hypothetical protein DIPPA_26828 [Diplonema papillatum]|nr:hypothetical protein DIPPA_24736 [Diplonema papillatum]KAJ9458607.1 hypothetical protein DIPPA_26828 [Diplonema papillatum]